MKCQCCSHIETSQLICTANQLTGFYMRATLAFNGLNSKGALLLSLVLCGLNRDGIMWLSDNAIKSDWIRYCGD